MLRLVQVASLAVLEFRKYIHLIEGLPPSARLLLDHTTIYIFENAATTPEEFEVGFRGYQTVPKFARFTLVQQREPEKWMMGFHEGKGEWSFDRVRLYVPFKLDRTSVINRKRVPKGKLQGVLLKVVENVITKGLPTNRFGKITINYAQESHGAIIGYETEWVDDLTVSNKEIVKLDKVRVMRYVLVPSDTNDGWILFGTFGYRFEHPTLEPFPHVKFFRVGFVDLTGKITSS